MAQVIALAICAAFYPTLLAGVIVLLTRPEPMRQLAAFYAGGMLMSLAAGLALLFLLDGSFQDPGKPASAGVDLAAGLVTLLVAWAVASGRVARLPGPRPRARRGAPGAEGGGGAGVRRLQRTLEHGSAPLAFAVGLVLNLPGVWYLAALKQIATDNGSTAADVAQVVVFNVIMFALVEVPLVGYLVAPRRTSDAVHAFDAWLRAHARAVGLGIAVAVGVYLVTKGLVEALG